MTLTAERVRELLDYDPETGAFRWKVTRKKRRALLEKPVGTVKHRGADHPYLVIWLEGRLYRAHRLAWLYVHGSWPAENIDHINGDTLDNRLCNLRECNQTQNNGNHRRLNRHNKSGYRGVSWSPAKGKWRASIYMNNRQKHLGYFATPENAYEAYKVAAVGHFGEFANV